MHLPVGRSGGAGAIIPARDLAQFGAEVTGRTSVATDGNLGSAERERERDSLRANPTDEKEARPRGGGGKELTFALERPQKATVVTSEATCSPRVSWWGPGR